MLKHQTLSPERILQLGAGYQASQVLRAAVHHRFFTHIHSGHRTAAAIAEAASTEPRSTEIILNALAGHTIESFETFHPEILAKSGMAEQARIQLKTWLRPAPANTFEERGLVMTVAMPQTRQK